MVVARLRQRVASLSPRAVDAVVAVALAAVITLAALASDEPGATQSVVAPFVLGAGMGGLAMFRRRWPVAVLAASTVLTLGYHGANFPAIGHGWPLVVALYTCASLGRLRPAVLIVAITFLAGGVGWLVFDPGPLLPILALGIREIAIIGLVLAFGDAVRSRRGWAAEAQDRVRRVERDRERETSRQVMAERVRIARELHDITAHTLAVAGVQLNVAADTLADSPDEARSALRAAQQANREAVAELKAAVQVLREERSEGAPRSPTPGLDGIGRLLDAAREAGLRVDFQQAGTARRLPAPVELAVYRVVQESLTNVLRHAGAATIQIEIGYDPEGLSVRVQDDGTGTRTGPVADGHGLIGMRERVRGLGGTFSAGPASGGGFAVTAQIPASSLLLAGASA